MKQTIELFESVEIRKIKKGGNYWVSATDVARAIGYSNPSRDVFNILKRNSIRFEGYSTIIKLMTVEGTRKVNRNTVMLNLKGVIALCMLSNLPKAIPFQRWADKVLEDHIKEKASRKQIYGEITDKTIEARNLETAEWQRHGAGKYDYGKLTKEEYKLLFGDNTLSKKELSGDEILKLTISNLTNVYMLRQELKPIGIRNVEKIMIKSTNHVNQIEVKQEAKE